MKILFMNFKMKSSIIEKKLFTKKEKEMENNQYYTDEEVIGSYLTA